jgi:precorrin-2/cobalt-factor-2 C20-methyltransferase
MLSFVGVGPGDPDLMTILAVRALARADVIAIADSGSGTSAVLRIAGSLVSEKPILKLKMPMIPGEDWGPAHDRAAETLIRRLKKGVRIAYPVLGDPSLYASSIYIYRRVAPRHPCEIIPGVPAMCAAAAALGAPLAEGRQTLTVLPGFGEGDRLPVGAAVVLKAGRVLDALREAAGNRRALLAQNLGMPDEYLGALEGARAEASYFSTVLIGPGNDEP